MTGSQGEALDSVYCVAPDHPHLVGNALTRGRR
jgi:hypothetical protein